MFVLLQEQDSSYTIIKSKELEMLVDGLRPASVYVFQVQHTPSSSPAPPSSSSCPPPHPFSASIFACAGAGQDLGRLRGLQPAL